MLSFSRQAPASRGLDSVSENVLTYISGFAKKIQTGYCGGIPI
jgi:hypothetical protein